MTNAAPQTVTFGCRLNSAESAIMAQHAARAGLQNAIIVNSCAVTNEAERQSRQAIRRLRRQQPQASIIVTGCAAHIDPQKYRAMPEVDHVLANDRKLLPESFTTFADKVADRALKPPDPQNLLPVSPLSLMQRAFIQVQNGCDHRCTFCIIPFGRGASRSLNLAEIVAQARDKTAQGFNEIVLTGVDITSYGHDLAAGPTLGAVIRSLLRHIPDLRRLRLSSLDPAALDEDLWQLIADEPRLMPHLHLSLQAGDDMILKRMKRRHNRADVLRLCDRARRLRPDIVFGADIIAGFPTETDAMFQNSYDLVERCGLTWLHVFPYSARQGTPASRMPQLDGALRKQRADTLRALGDRAALAHHTALLGKKIAVLVENNGIGCTPHFAKLNLLGPAPVGQIVDVTCLGMENNVMTARSENIL